MFEASLGENDRAGLGGTFLGFKGNWPLSKRLKIKYAWL